MPYINVTTSVQLSEEQHKKLVKELGVIITDIPGKTEEWLMINLKDDSNLYFKGVKQELAAVVEINIFGAAQRKDKESITKKICEYLHVQLSIATENIFITFREVEDWGWNGIMF